MGFCRRYAKTSAQLPASNNLTTKLVGEGAQRHRRMDYYTFFGLTSYYEWGHMVETFTLGTFQIGKPHRPRVHSGPGSRKVWGTWRSGPDGAHDTNCALVWSGSPP